MNFAVILLGVTFMVLNTMTIPSVSSQDSNGQTLLPVIVYDITFLTDEQRIPVDSFVTNFSAFVKSSNILADVYDISDQPSIEFTQFANRTIIDILRAAGANNPELFANIATLPMSQNFEFFPPQPLITVYAYLAGIYLYSEKILMQNNTVELAQEYATIVEKNANAYVVPGNTSTKFPAILKGFMEFATTYGTWTAENAVKLCYIYEGLWLTIAVETGSSNDLYMQCILDAEEDSKESNSGSDSSSSESDSSSSESDSSSSDSDSSSVKSDSSSTGSHSSSTESDSSSTESDSSSTESDSSSTESDSSSTESDSSSTESDSSTSGLEESKCGSSSSK